MKLSFESTLTCLVFIPSISSSNIKFSYGVNYVSDMKFVGCEVMMNKEHFSSVFADCLFNLTQIYLTMSLILKMYFEIMLLLFRGV